MNTYRDGRRHPTASDMRPLQRTVTVNVTNVDEAGTLTLSTLQPVDGIELRYAIPTLTILTALLIRRLPPGSGPSPPARRAPMDRHRRADGVHLYASTCRHKPLPARHGDLQADPQGSGKTAVVTTANRVLVTRSTNTAPVFKDADGVEIVDDIRADERGGREHAEGVVVGVPVVATDD